VAAFALKLKRQLLDHSGLFAPYNVLMYAFSAVRGRPFVERSQFAALDPLRDGWRGVRTRRRRRGSTPPMTWHKRGRRNVLP